MKKMDTAKNSMKALILDGSSIEGHVLTILNNYLKKELENRGWITDTYHLLNEDIGTCIGCFGCWVKTPGQCVIQDKGQEIIKKIAQTDLLILSSPITFGGYSYQLKKIVDRMIPNVLPLFERFNGEIHHKQRYPYTPNLLVIGYQKNKDPESEDIFRTLVTRNTLNFRPSQHYTWIINDNVNFENTSSILEDSGVLT